MSGNSPNVSRNNFGYSHLLVGDCEVMYDSAPLQQGVPVVDSDINEMQDYLRMSQILSNLALFGSDGCRIALTVSEVSSGGFFIRQASQSVNNFEVVGGFAIVGGVLVPTTMDTPPIDFDYNDQILYSGALTNITGASLEDTSKYFTAEDSLSVSAVAPIHAPCILKITSGTEDGHYGYILPGYGSTTVEIDTTTDVIISGSTKTRIIPANLVIGNTYQILCPALTTPASPRTDQIYVEVWFDDICNLEDTTIENANVGIECVHKTARRSVVRVSEGAVVPALSEANKFGFGRRRMVLSSVARTAVSAITNGLITNSTAPFTPFSGYNSELVYFDQTIMDSIGYTTAGVDPNVQDCVDQIMLDLRSELSGLGSSLLGSYGITQTPSSTTPGTLYNTLTELLTFINARVDEVHPSTSIMVPTPIWRSHGKALTETSGITPDTITVYLMPSKSTFPASRGNYAMCVGCWLDNAQACGPAGSISASMVYYGASFTSFCYKNSALTTPWSWDVDATPQWDTLYSYGIDGFNLLVPGGSVLGMDTNGDLAYIGRTFSLAMSGAFTAVMSGDFRVAAAGDATLASSVEVNLIATDAIRVMTPLMTLHEAYIAPYTKPGSVDPRLTISACHDVNNYNGAIWLLDHAVWITSGVSWDSNTHKWMPLSGVVDSYASIISGFGITHCVMTTTFPGYMSGWNLYSWASMTGKNTLANEHLSGDCLRSCDTLVGFKYYEEVIIAHQTQLNQSGGSVDLNHRIPVNFRNFMTIPPNAHFAAPIESNNLFDINYFPINGWGGYIIIEYAGIVGGQTGSYVGRVLFYAD
jgi:hypothetical protein